MNTLITGGTGFIGRALVNRLFKEGNRVVLLTRAADRVDGLLRKKADILEADICDPASLEKLDARSQGIDVVIHLAAVLDYFGDERKLFRVNVEGTINLLNFAKKTGIKRFIYISSIEAMGTAGKGDIPANEAFACKPISPYGASKLEAEKQIRRLAKERGINAVILRLGNVFGPGSPAFIIPIANAILKDGALLRFLPIYKDRHLHPVYIEDAVNGIITASQRKDISGVYIIAGEEYVTIETLFMLIAQELNMDINLQSGKTIKDALFLDLRKKLYKFRKMADLLTYLTAGEGMRVHRAYSIETARNELGYSPKTNLKDGIAKTIRWAEENNILVK